MKIVIDSQTGTVKVGSKTFAELTSSKQHEVNQAIQSFVKTQPLSDFEEDSIWMSYRYCIGRHTIAAHQRAHDIFKYAYGRMSDSRSVFTAYDMNREVEGVLSHGGVGPEFQFPITGHNRIYTTALDIFCQFVEDNRITDKRDLLKYKTVYIIPYDNERGYKFETVTWEEWRKAQLEAHPENKENINKRYNEAVGREHFYLDTIDDLMIWNDVIHLFDKEHHHKSILKDGSEVEWVWTYTNSTEEREDGNFYMKEIGYDRIRVGINEWSPYRTCWIPDDAIEKDLY